MNRQSMNKSIYTIFPIDWRSSRNPVEFMCNTQTTRKRLARLNTSILLAIHKGKSPRIINAIRDTKKYYSEKLAIFIADENSKTSEG
jgi:hypothetical protein